MPPKADIAKVTIAQRECLQCVLQGYEAKEIAQKLGISHSAVIERLRASRQATGAATSKEAARIVAAELGWADNMRHVDKPIGVVVADPPAFYSSLSARQVEEDADDLEQSSVELRRVSPAASGSAKYRFLSLPFPTADQPRNQLSVAQTLMWLILLTIGLACAGIAAIALVDQLSRLV
jgi:DNA-binding CsgD family transcriptional regulator